MMQTSSSTLINMVEKSKNIVQLGNFSKYVHVPRPVIDRLILPNLK